MAQLPFPETADSFLIGHCLTLSLLQAEKIKWEALVAKIDETEQISKGTLAYPAAVTDRNGLVGRLHATVIYILALFDWYVKQKQN